jgi:hypothetical protein
MRAAYSLLFVVLSAAIAPCAEAAAEASDSSVPAREDKRLQLVIDLGGDLQGGWVFMVGPTWRF